MSFLYEVGIAKIIIVKIMQRMSTKTIRVMSYKIDTHQTPGRQKY